MENNEIMNEVMDTVIEDVVVDTIPAKGTGMTVAIVAGVTLAVGAGVVLAKKAIGKYKAKKEMRQPDKEIDVEDEDLIEVVVEEQP